LLALALSLFWLLLAAAAQKSAKIPRVGVLEPGFPPTVTPRPCLEFFQQGLGDLGYREGQNIVLEYRYGEFKPDRLPGQLQHRQVDEHQRSDRPVQEADPAEEMERPVPVAAHEGDGEQIEEAAHVTLHPVARAPVLALAVIDGELGDAEAAKWLTKEYRKPYQIG